MNFKNISRYIPIALCIVALAGFWLPAIRVELSFLGISRSTNLSIATFFESTDSPMETLNLGQTDISDILGENDMLQDAGARIALAVISYLLSLLATLALLIFTFLNKFVIIRIVLAAMAAVLLAVAARAILSVPDIIAETLTNILGFFAMFLNLSEMIQITLGSGLWTPAITLVIIFLFELTLRFRKVKKAYYSTD